jgi:hypothetical protein
MGFLILSIFVYLRRSYYPVGAGLYQRKTLITQPIISQNPPASTADGKCPKAIIEGWIDFSRSG